MPVFERLSGQERSLELLERALAAGRLGHAYLFAGPSGSGRLTAALELAAAVVCGEEEAGSGYCGECRDCLRIFSFSHPDVRLTVPMTAGASPEELAALVAARLEDGFSPLAMQGSASIRIDQIREMETRLSRRSYEGRGHVEIVLGAERMRREAANALLKTLEEPPDDTLLVLVTESWSSLLPTIRSRAHLVRFRRLPAGEVAAIVSERTGATGAEALRAAVTADGRPGLALRMLQEGGAADSPALELLRELSVCASVSDVLGIAASRSRKLGRTGCILLMRELRSLMHDLARGAWGLGPTAHLPEDLECVPEVFRGGVPSAPAGPLAEAERMLEANVMSGMAISSALLSVWSAVRGGGGDAKR